LSQLLSPVGFASRTPLSMVLIVLQIWLCPCKLRFMADRYVVVSCWLCLMYLMDIIVNLALCTCWLTDEWYYALAMWFVLIYRDSGENRKEIRSKGALLSLTLGTSVTLGKHTHLHRPDGTDWQMVSKFCMYARNTLGKLFCHMDSVCPDVVHEKIPRKAEVNEWFHWLWLQIFIVHQQPDVQCGYTVCVPWKKTWQFPLHNDWTKT
jgi:hypothetical protein